MKYVFWLITLCGPERAGRFEGTCRHLWGRKVSQARNERQAKRGYSSTPEKGALCSSETSASLGNVRY
jgi:hypothetical protein